MLDSKWISVCEFDDLVPDTGACARINDSQVAIFFEGRSKALYGLSNFDPVGGANVMSRGILGSIGAELVVASPLYKQHYSLTTGQCLEQPEYKLKTYSVRVEQGLVQIKPE